MSSNPNSVVNQGEFHDSVPRTKSNEGPTIHNKFKPGSQVAPQYTTQVLDAGSAPEDKSYHPDLMEKAGGQSYPESNKDAWTYVEDTLTGASSKDVYNTNTMGKPFQGKWTQSDAKFARHRGEGVESYGSSQTDPKEAKGATKEQNSQGGKLNDREALKNEGLVGAEERENVTGEEAARQATKSTGN